jgi:hypothetical protein
MKQLLMQLGNSHNIEISKYKLDLKFGEKGSMTNDGPKCLETRSLKKIFHIFVYKTIFNKHHNKK